MTTSYERLREECNKMLPERLELKFGCEIDVLGQWCDRMTVLYECSKCRRHKTATGCEKYEGDCDYDNAVCALQEQYLDCPLEWVVKASDIDKILGTPLTITDVLRAVGKTKGTLYTKVLGETLRLSDDGTILEYFDLAAPLSDPSNAAACEAVLSIITKTV